MKRLAQLFLLAAAVCSVSTQGYPWWHKCNWCGIGASCKAGAECVCPGKGNPYLYCHEASKFICEHCNDPALRTETDDGVMASYFGITRLLDAQYNGPGSKGCHIRVAVSAFRVNGKVLARCIWIWLKYRTPAGELVILRFKVKAYYVDASQSLVYEVLERVTDPADNSTSWKDLATLSSGQNGQKELDKVGQSCWARFYIVKGSILRVTFSCCEDVTILMRAHVLFSDWLKSGVVITSPKPHRQNLALPTPLRNYPLCLNPGVTLKDVKKACGLDSARHAMAFLGLTQTFAAHSGFSDEQRDMANALHACKAAGKLKEFFKRAFFMTHWPPFIRAISVDLGDGFDEIMSAVERAAKWICDGDVVACASLRAEIKAKAEHLFPKKKGLKDFYDAGCSP